MEVWGYACASIRDLTTQMSYNTSTQNEPSDQVTPPDCNVSLISGNTFIWVKKATRQLNFGLDFICQSKTVSMV